MRLTGWAAFVLCAALTTACGPNATPMMQEAGTPTAEGDVTPVSWRIEPTPTPGLLTPTPGPLIRPPVPPPPPQASTARPLVSPTIGVPRAPLPTPTPEPPLQCQFSDGAVTLQPTYTAAPEPTPGVVPTFYQGAPGYTTFAAGEPLPGVALDLQLPQTTFVAGTSVRPQIQVHNMSPTGVTLDSGVWTVADGHAEPAPPFPADPRSFPSFHHGPVGPTVPSGQTWSFSSLVQLPFDATQPVHLHALARLFVVPSPTPTNSGLTVMADVPVQLTAPTPDQELELELHADHDQWCLRAITAAGGPPAEPLVVRLVARSARWYSERVPDAGSAGTWAGRWHFDALSQINGVTRKQSDDAFTFSAWVGGPDYVTAVTPQTFVAEP